MVFKIKINLYFREKYKCYFGEESPILPKFTRNWVGNIGDSERLFIHHSEIVGKKTRLLNVANVRGD